MNVSVIVAAYNAEKTIEECILSLLALNYPKENLEIIFVNNSSTDSTLEILNKYRPSIRILQEEKRGSAAARNKGILNATGNVIAFTDADCIVDQDWLQNLVLPLQDAQVGVVGGKILATRPCNKIEAFGEKIHDHEKAITIFKPPSAITANWASRLAILQDVRLFDENLIRSQDTDLSRRIYHAGYRLVYEPEAIIYHHNEKTLWGLFTEGFTHGFYAVKVHKKHAVSLKIFRYRRFYAATYIKLLESLVNYIKGNARDYSLYYFIFNSGKKIGRIIGSIRFFYLTL